MCGETPSHPRTRPRFRVFLVPACPVVAPPPSSPSPVASSKLSTAPLQQPGDVAAAVTPGPGTHAGWVAGRMDGTRRATDSGRWGAPSGEAATGRDRGLGWTGLGEGAGAGATVRRLRCSATVAAITSHLGAREKQHEK
ncbi:hypothetical protein EDC01DRAFT_780768 [Geopyxis carbonaria]|nr:hypothetical protein EDC01DRAFT_780768 [Geopyxis carbonaria]